MPHFVYQVPGDLEHAWKNSMEYWQKAYSCEIKETRDTSNGGRFLRVKKKLDIGTFGFTVDLQFDPVDGGTRVTIDSDARGAQLGLFATFVQNWCKIFGISDQGVRRKSTQGLCICSCVFGVLLLILVIWALTQQAASY
jgi:hypothetical protein